MRDSETISVDVSRRLLIKASGRIMFPGARLDAPVTAAVQRESAGGCVVVNYRAY